MKRQLLPIASVAVLLLAAVILLRNQALRTQPQHEQSKAESTPFDAAEHVASTSTSRMEQVQVELQAHLRAVDRLETIDDAGLGELRAIETILLREGFDEQLERAVLEFAIESKGRFTSLLGIVLGRGRGILSRKRTLVLLDAQATATTALMIAYGLALESYDSQSQQPAPVQFWHAALQDSLGRLLGNPVKHLGANPFRQEGDAIVGFREHLRKLTDPSLVGALLNYLSGAEARDWVAFELVDSSDTAVLDALEGAYQLSASPSFRSALLSKIADAATARSSAFILRSLETEVSTEARRTLLARVLQDDRVSSAIKQELLEVEYRRGNQDTQTLDLLISKAGSLNSDQAVRWLAQIAAASDQPERRSSAVQALAHSHSESPAASVLKHETLLAALRDTNARVRQVAVSVLANREGDAAMPLLAPLAQTDPDPEVRRFVVEVLKVYKNK